MTQTVCRDSREKARIVFMGSPEFALPTLEVLCQHCDIRAVYTQPPRQSGRGLHQRKTAVGQRAEELGLACFWPQTLKTEEEQKQLAGFEADLFIVVAYGLILPQAVLDMPVHGCINSHASLLPRWRGAAPIQRAIEAGDSHTGVSIMQMQAGLDTGPVLTAKKTEITPEMTAGRLHDRLAGLSAEMMPQAIDAIMAKRIQPQPQPQDGICYAPKLGPADTRLSLAQPAVRAARKIQALSPVPGTAIDTVSGRLKLLTAEAMDGQSTEAAPGTFLGRTKDEGLLLACAKNTVLKVKTIQPAGRQIMSGGAFLNGHSWAAGDMVLESV